MSVNFQGYNTNINTPKTQANDTPQQQKKVTTTTTVASGAVLASVGITAGILTKGKSGAKIAEAIGKKLPGLEAKAKNIWGKLTGSAKKEEELRKAQQEAQKHAEEVQKKLEAQRKAEQEALEQRKKAVEEAKRQQEIKKAEEAAKKAEAQKAALLAQKAKEANKSFKHTAENTLAEYIDPKTAVHNNTPMIEGESFNNYLARLKEKESQIDVYEFTNKIQNTEPQTVFGVVFEQLEKCHQNGGTATVDDVLNILSNSKNTMENTVFDLKQTNPYSTYSIERVQNKFSDYKKYVDEVIAEIKAANTEGEPAPSVIKKALKNIENKKIARQARVDEIAQGYEQQLAPIRQRLQYSEASIPPVDKSVTLSREETQKLADEINEIIASGGSNPNFGADTPLYQLQQAWKQKYISMPFTMQDKTGETAILDMFPRYKAGIQRVDGKECPFKTAGEFTYEPLYRQMHIENPEEFVKQFENIGGEYAPGRIQSCSKEKLFGECWGSLGNERYGFTEWSPGNNVKFVFHPKGPVSNAADIGEGKYGSYEAIYAANSRFRILGTVKKTVTPEEIKKGIPGFKNQFEDFEKYEIHLQEM